MRVKCFNQITSWDISAGEASYRDDLRRHLFPIHAMRPVPRSICSSRNTTRLLLLLLYSNGTVNMPMMWPISNSARYILEHERRLALKLIHEGYLRLQYFY